MANVIQSAISAIRNKASEMFNDNQGFVQQGKFTLQPVQQAYKNWQAKPSNVIGSKLIKATGPIGQALVGFTQGAGGSFLPKPIKEAVYQNIPKPQGTLQQSANIAGNIAGFTYGLPGKAMGALDVAGKVGVSKFLPKISPLAQKITAGIGSEALQTAGLLGAQKISGENVGLKDIPGQLLMGLGLRGISNINAIKSSKFRMDNPTYKELEDAADMLANPKKFLAMEDITKYPETQRKQLIKNAVADIENRAKEVVDLISEKYLPTDFKRTGMTYKDKIKALVDLNAQNKLGNINYLVENKPKITGEVGVAKVDPLESLKQEARKYKSAEEFVNISDAMDRTKIYDTKLRNALGQLDSQKIKYGDEVLTGRHFVQKLVEEGWKPSEYSKGFSKGYKLSKDGVGTINITGPQMEAYKYYSIPENFSKTKSQLTNIYNQAKRLKIKPKEVPPVVQESLDKVAEAKSQLENTQLPQPEVSSKTLSNQISPQTIPEVVSSPKSVTQTATNLLEQQRKTLLDQREMLKAEQSINKETLEPFKGATDELYKVKRLLNSKAYLEGDIETLRRSGYGRKIENALEEVWARNPNITTEQEALDFIQNLPTVKSIPKIKLTPEEKTIRLNALREQAKWEKDFGKSISGEITATEAKQQMESLGGTLTPKQYQAQQSKKIRMQSEASRKASNEAIKYFNDINIPAYKKGKVNLGESLPADELLKTAKDKVAFAYQRETIQRNVEDIFGKDSKMKKFVVDNITGNENKSVQFQNTLRNDLERTFSKNNIKKGSKQDYAAADFIEGNLDLNQLKKEFPKDWYKIVKVAEEGRMVYKSLLTRINEQLTRFGYDAIPERQNYVTHTTQLQTFADKLGSMFNLNSDELPRAMAGINMDTQPGKKFFSFGLQRKGGSTHEGLITALDKYIPSASRQIFHTEDIQRGRAILDLLQKSADEGDTRLSGFTSYFSQFVDHLAGKQNVIDRPIEKVFGRKFLEVGNWVRQRTGANMVGANMSSAITNFIPFTQSAATTSKPAFAKGLLESATNYGKPPELIDGVRSGFLLRRFAKNRITGTLGENIQDMASLPFKLVDKFTSTAIVAGKYFEQVGKGLSKEKAMAVADDYAQRVMADRSFGQSPLLFNSKVLGALTQFQLEVNNQMSFLMKDIPKNMGYSKAQIASSLVQFAVYSYIFNNIYQKVVGRRPQIDPINAVLETSKDLQDGQGLQAFNPIDPYTKGISDKTGTGQILNSLPFTSIGGGRIPITQAFKQPQYYLLPPFGGGQIKKTFEGINAYNKGYSESASGNVQYPIEQNPINAVKTAVLGKYSVPEAGKYFANNEKTLSASQTEKFKQAPDRLKFYSDVINNRQLNRDINDVTATMQAELSKNGTVKPEQVGNVYLIPDNGVISKVELKQLSLPEKTGDTTKDNKAISSFKSNITTQLKQVDRLVTAGAMSEAQGTELKNNLESLRSGLTTSKTSKLKVKKAKKPKKIKISAPKKIKVSKLKATKIKKPKSLKLKFKKSKPIRLKIAYRS